MKSKNEKGRGIFSRARRSNHRDETLAAALGAIVDKLETRVMLTGANLWFTPAVQTNYLPDNHVITNSSNGFVAASTEGTPLDLAIGYLKQNAPSLGLTAADIGTPLVTSQYTDADTGITHIYLRQTYDGLPIKNADMTVNLSRDNKIISAGGSFVHTSGGNLAAAGAITPTRSPVQAAFDAAKALGLSSPIGAAIVGTDVTAHNAVSVLRAQSLSQDDIPVSLHFIPTEDGLKLAWDTTIRTKDNDHWYNVSISDADGVMLDQADWIDNDASYNVYARPTESPSDGPRTIVASPQDPTASPFGWHDTNGTAGAEFTDTRGNNVFAQEDADDNDTGGFRPDGTASLTFDFPLDLTQSPQTNQSAMITNLFYWNNLLHDIHNAYGFTSAAGNFQNNTYGQGGVGNDQVMADAQDGSGTNNANFGTPPDGQSGRMQMYLFNLTSPGRDGDIDNQIIVHEYGHGVSNRLTGGPANANGLTATQSGGMGEGWSDWWSLMLTQKTTDTKLAAYPVGTYVLGQSPTGAGIRRKPYSFDMSIDPLTMDSYGISGTGGGVSRSTEVHDTGEIWCTTLWDMNWLLVDKYGFNPNVAAGYTGAGSAGNILALKLVMDALKLQPANPTFLQSRDAILLADTNLTGGQNQLAIWTAFARRGMGFSANAGANANVTTVTAAFDLPANLLDPVVTSIAPPVITGATATSLSFNFSKAMDPASFSTAADINSFTGPAAQNLLPTVTGSVWSNGNQTLTINFSQLPSDGLYLMVIGPNILSADNGHAMNQDGDGNVGEPVEDRYNASFRYDSVPLTVTSTSPTQNQNVQLPLTSILLTFNENVAAASVTASDLTISQGTVGSAAVENGNQVRFNISGLTTEGTVTYTLAAGKVTDAGGGPNAAYTGSFVTDFGTVAFPALTQRSFAGSQVYSATTTGILGVGDSDSFTINLDAGQKLSLWLDPAAALQPTITLKDPSSATIATATGSAANIEAVINSTTISSNGLYTIVVTGAGGTTGAYTLGAALNAAVESEQHDGATNDTRATAQNLDSVFTQIGTTGGSRAAVLGRLPGNTGLISDSDDFESGSLGGKWTTYSSTVEGRIQVTGTATTGGGAFALVMDNGTDSGSYVLNEAIWTVNLAGVTTPTLNFQHNSFGDENELFSTSFSGHFNADGVAISSDGNTWVPLFSADSPGAWTSKSFDLAAAAASAGISLGANFKIKFQQYDNFALGTDGRGFDNISITTPAPPNDFYAVTLATGQTLSTRVQALSSVTGNIVLSLQDSSGTTLAVGAGGTNNGLNDFVAPSSATYYLVVSNPANADYNLFVAKDATLDTEFNDAPGIAQVPLSRVIANEQSIVGYASASNAADVYAIVAQTGNVIDLTTFTPGGGAGEFTNNLNPRLRLLDSNGMQVAIDDNSAADGKNAHLTFNVTTGGAYYVEISPSLSPAGTVGEYGLSIKGGTTPVPAFAVALTNPVNGGGAMTFPTTMTVDFNDSILLSTLQASDLKVDGNSATNFTVVDDNTVTFTLAAGGGLGLHNVAIAAGAISDIQGTALTAYNGTFSVDNVAPRVINSSIKENDTIATSSTTITITFDEPMSNIDQFDLSLVGATTGSRSFSNDTWSQNNTVLTLTYTGDYKEDSFTLTLLSGTGKFEDVAGNDLDGEAVWPMPPNVSGNGVAGGNFVVHFNADIVSSFFPTVTARAPLGSLVYDAIAPGQIGVIGDTDGFDLFNTADPGFPTTFIAHPTAPGLRPVVEIVQVNVGTIATATAAAPGQDAILTVTSLPAGGTFFIRVSGANNTVGAYTIQEIINAAPEAESHGGPSNSTRQTAQSLDAAFISPVAGVSRAAVIGLGTESGAGTLFDFTSGAQGFVVNNGTTGLWHLSTGHGNDAGHSATQSFYYGKGETITGGGTYDTGLQNAGTLTSPSFVVPPNANVAFNYILQTENSVAWDNSTLQISTNGGGSWTTLASYNGVSESLTWKTSTAVSLAAYSGQTASLRWAFDTVDSVGNTFEGWYVDDVVIGTGVGTDYYSFTLNSGQTATAAIAANSGSGTLDLSLLDSNGNVLATGVSGATNLTEIISNFAAPSSGTYYLQVVAATGLEYNLHVNKNAAFDTEANNSLATAQTMEPAGTAIGNLTAGDSDYYKITATIGSVINLTTYTPGDANGAPSNLLNPRIELYSPAGALVASNDNGAADGKNALLNYVALANGNYTVRVFATTNTGEYVLKAGRSSISGSLFQDINSDGIKNGADAGMNGWTIYLDANNNNVKDATETSTITDASGNYTFANLFAGNYAVRQVFQSGYRKSLPGKGIAGYDVTLGDSQTVTGKDFGNTTNIYLGGKVFNDANSNGAQDVGEAVLPGFVINIISNGITVASRTTDATGSWKVQGLAAGSGHADVVLQAGYTPTFPGGGTYVGSMTAGEQNANLNFGLHFAGPAPAPLAKDSSLLIGQFHGLNFFSDEKDVA